MRITDTGTSKIENANTRESRVTSKTKKEPEFTGPAKYSPFVETLKAVNNTKISAEEKAVKDALAAVQADTGVEKALSIISGYSPGDFRTAEERSNEPFYASQQGFGSASLVSNNFIPVVTPTPLTPSAISATAVTPPPPPVKTATLDIILFDDEATTVDTMADLIFENIGGQELINITRSDIINGQKISYQPIKNLSSIQQRYNPNNILSLQQTADKYFAGFSIKLEDKIPNEGNGANGENVYIEEGTGDLIIEFININNDEQIEVQITSDGTIYEADLGEINS